MQNKENNINNYIYNFKTLSNKEISALKKQINGKFKYSTEEISKINKKTKISIPKIIKYIDIIKKQEQSTWNDFFKNAEETLKRIMLNNEYAIINYHRNRNNIRIQRNNCKLGDIFYNKKY